MQWWIVWATRASGGIGIRVRLRSVWGNPWEFKSPLAHSKPVRALAGSILVACLL